MADQEELEEEVYEAGEEVYQQSAQEMQQEESSTDKAENVEMAAAAEEVSNEMSGLFIQKGAHRNYEVPEKFVLWRAPKNYPVKDCLTLGKLTTLRSVPVWDGIKWFHITMLGDDKEMGPFICFDPPEEGTDDANWCRPVHAKIMEYYIPRWKDDIRARFGGDEDKHRAVLKKYKMVLRWTTAKMAGPSFDPDILGIGNGGFRLLKEKLKTCRVIPASVPRGAKAADALHPKLQSAIAKSAPKAVSARSEAESVDSEATVEAKTIRVGSQSTTQTFVIDGIIYATTIA